MKPPPAPPEGRSSSWLGGRMKARSNKREELFTTKKKAKIRNVEKKGFHRNEMACPPTYDILKENAKANRMKMTDAERALWEKLKDKFKPNVCMKYAIPESPQKPETNSTDVVYTKYSIPQEPKS